MKKIVLLLLLFSITLTAQERILKEANEYYKSYSFAKAAENYYTYIEKTENPSLEILKKAGNSFYNLHQPFKALKYYERIYEILGSNISDKYYLLYIQCLRQVRDYEEAEKHTQIYIARKNDQQLLNRFKKQKKDLDSLENIEPHYSISNLDINTKNADFGGTFYKDKVVFSSSKKTSEFKDTYSWNDQPFLNLYIADRNGTTGKLSNPKLFLPEKLPKQYHDANITFSSSFDTLYFTHNKVQKKARLFKKDERTITLQIIRAILKNGKVVKQKPLLFTQDKYSYGHPTLSKNGKWLFFTSDAPEGFGLTDIYVVEVFKDGTTNTPKNLGNVINTEGREMFPFIKDSVLYFASEGHYGLGGLDIFKSTMNEDLTFSTPENLGSPINSNRDDFAFIIDSLNSKGYFSSNRLQGKGDDDIYSFIKKEIKCQQIISGKVIDSFSKKPISFAKIKVFQEEKKYAETTTDSLGNYSIKLPCKKTFLIKANKKNYSEEAREVATTEQHDKKHKEINFKLINYEDLIEKEGNQEKISINPIYFEYNKANITPQAAAELDKVVFALNKFPALKIKIESHTDARGKSSYNLSLSQARASATESYLLSQGINSDRILEALGFGETKLLNECEDGVECSEAKHKQNRRSNFIVVEK